jgi:hypothetical protein
MRKKPWEGRQYAFHVRSGLSPRKQKNLAPSHWYCLRKRQNERAIASDFPVPDVPSNQITGGAVTSMLHRKARVSSIHPSWAKAWIPALETSTEVLEAMNVS